MLPLSQLSARERNVTAPVVEYRRRGLAASICQLVQNRPDDVGAFFLSGRHGRKDHRVGMILVPVEAITKAVVPLGSLPTPKLNRAPATPIRLTSTA